MAIIKNRKSETSNHRQIIHLNRSTSDENTPEASTYLQPYTQIVLVCMYTGYSWHESFDNAQSFKPHITKYDQQNII